MVFFCHNFSSSSLQPGNNTSSKSRHIHISVSKSTISNDLFLAISNLQGFIISLFTITFSFDFNFSIVLSLLPVSNTNILSASLMLLYHLSTYFSSFLHIAYMHILYLFIIYSFLLFLYYNL